MSWQAFLQQMADVHQLSPEQREAFLARFTDENIGKSEAKIADNLHIGVAAFKKRMTEIYDKFAQSCREIAASGSRGKFEKLRAWLRAQHSNPSKPSATPATGIDWHSVCHQVLAEQQLRRKATEWGFELNIFVPLGLVERKQQQRRSGDVPLEQVYQLEQEVIIQTYKHDEFLEKIIKPSQNKHIAIIGEPGAGKTTILREIAKFIQKDNKGLPICIQLADLQGQTLEDYLLQRWLKQKALPIIKELSPNVVPSLLEVPQALQDALADVFCAGKVWLLLDGVDEIATASPIEALTKIQTQLTGWLKHARVVLTCRLNVWDASVNNTLTGFETYKTLEFAQDEVKQFIRLWFAEAGKQERGEQLIIKLNEAGRERIRELVGNPLRLALLCQISYRNPSNLPDLPETKAALYQLFTRYSFEWKQEQHSINLTDRDKLIQALGKLALAGINSKNRFRLPESLAHKEMGERLFELAEKIGWLNLVDRDAKTDEPVYAFFHPTFQEYFAALGIEDWHDFLNHNNENPNPFVKYNNKDCVYRIFEPQWKQVILLWLGREGVVKEQKEEFIKALMEFDDRCGKCYQERAYFLAAAGIAEFRDCKLADKIVSLLVKLAYGYFDIQEHRWQTFCQVIQETSKKTLRETDRNLVINVLTNLLNCNIDNNEALCEAAVYLLQISPGNQKSINTMNALLRSAKHQLTRERAAFWLLEDNPDPTNSKAIKLLLQPQHMSWNTWKNLQANDSNALNKLLQISRDQYTFNSQKDTKNWKRVIVENPDEISAIIERLHNTQRVLNNKNLILEWAKQLNSFNLPSQNNSKSFPSSPSLVSSKDIYLLGRIGVGNLDAIKALLEFARAIESNSEIEILYSDALLTLGKIGANNPEVINYLLMVMHTTSHDLNRLWAVRAIRQGLHGNLLPIIVKGLKRFLQKPLEEKISDSIPHLCYEIIWHCAQNMPYPEFYQAWHNSPITPHPEAPDDIPTGYTPTVQSLETLIADICTQLQPTRNTHLLCINAEALTEETDTSAIAQFLCNRIFQKAFLNETPPAVNNVAQLERSLIQLKQQLQQPNLALILHSCEPHPELVRFCRQLIDVLHIGFITDSSIEPPLKGFQPNQPNLVSAIGSWLDEMG